MRHTVITRTGIYALTLAFGAFAAGCSDRHEQSRLEKPRVSKDSARVVAVAEEDPSAESRTIRPQNHADSLLAAQLVEMRARIDSLGAQPTGLTLRLAALTADSHLVRVKDEKSWPEGTIHSFAIRKDGRGRVVYAYDVPTSESGDWFNEYTYYFDSSGNTFAFRRRSSFFTGCEGGGSRETSVTYFAPGGRVIRRDYGLTAFDNTTVRDPKNCEFLYRHPYVIYSTWPQWSDATGFTRLDSTQTP